MDIASMSTGDNLDTNGMIAISGDPMPTRFRRSALPADYLHTNTPPILNDPTYDSSKSLRIVQDLVMVSTINVQWARGKTFSCSHKGIPASPLSDGTELEGWAR